MATALHKMCEIVLIRQLPDAIIFFIVMYRHKFVFHFRILVARS